MIYQDPVARTLPRFLDEAAAAWRDKPLVRFPNVTVTYRDLAERSHLFAGALQALGVGKGDTVLVVAGNRAEYLETWWGICRLGAVEVPVNFGLKGRLLAHVLRDSQAKVAVVEAEFLPEVEAVLDDVPRLETIILIGDRARPVRGRSVVGFDQIARRPAESVEVRYGDVAAIMYTSGSTGPAKGAMLSHNYFLRFGEEKVRHLRTGPADVIYNCYPLFNLSGQTEAVVAAMCVGASVYQAPRFSASRFWSDIREQGCTEFIYMGGILSILEKAEPRPDDGDNPIRTGYGVPTPADLHPRFEKRFGCMLVEVYGSTEANTVTFNPYDARKWGSCGLPTAGYDVRLVDEDDNEVGPGEVGEMLVRPQRAHSVFEGYWGLPEKTLAAFRGLWYRTGDLLRRDEDGYFYFVSRKVEAIRHKGYRISAGDIEGVVREFPGVLECAAVGVPDGRGEEEIWLLLVEKEDEPLDLDAVRRRCEKELPAWMVPRYLEVRADFPKTPTQKVEKFRLKQEGLGPHARDFGAYRPERATG